MINLYASTKVLACFLLLVCLFYACGTSQTATDKIATNPTDSAVASDTIPVFFLSSLTVTDGVFKANNNKNFAFTYFMGDTAVTLHGWVLKKGALGGSGTYNPTPDLKLESIGRTAIRVKHNTYIGNQVILGKEVKKIVKYLEDNNADDGAVLFFTPKRDDSTGRINYTIRIEFKVNGIPRHPAVAFELETNPAPPRQAYD